MIERRYFLRDDAIPEYVDAPPPEPARVVKGIALRYGSLSIPLVDAKGRKFRERFESGSFAKSLETADVRLLVNHDRNLLFGRTSSGTLRVIDGPDALRFECDWPCTSIAGHYAASMNRGDLDACSVNFICLKDSWTSQGDMAIRTVHEAVLREITIATFPAYLDTSAALVSEPDPAPEEAPEAPSQAPPADRDALRRRVRLRLASSY